MDEFKINAEERTMEKKIDSQNNTINMKRHECIYRHLMEMKSQDSDSHCPSTWDGIFCWPRVEAGTLYEVQCPTYISGFIPEANASRYCRPDGTWYVREGTNNTWSNYSLCYLRSTATYGHGYGRHNGTIIEEYLPVIKTISRLGYACSLSSLLIAFFVLAFIKRLRCSRNNLHMHLFVSFMFRAFMTLLKDNLMIAGIGLQANLLLGSDGKPIYFQEDETWDCKVLISIWQYFLMANYCWILMEGLYLHNLIFLVLFNDNSGIMLYVILGWGLPLLFIVPWAIVRVHYENVLCWTTHSNEAIFWIIRGPITVSIVVNFIFFLNITRILFLKLKSSYAPDSRNNRFKKLARSTLVLLPLFGVHYTVFIAMSTTLGMDEITETVWLFCDQFFSAFQGFFVAILYCFLNGEVQAEIWKKWQRWNLSRGQNCNGRSSVATQSLTYFSRPRNSLHSLTTSGVIDPLSKKECRSTTPSPNFVRSDRLSCLHRSNTASNKDDGMGENSTCTTWSYCPKMSDGNTNCDKPTILLPPPSPGGALGSYDRLVNLTPTIDHLALSPMPNSEAGEEAKLLASSPLYGYCNNKNESLF